MKRRVPTVRGMAVTQLFVVRLWCIESNPAGFYASVRRVDSEQARLFTSAGELARYLEQQAVHPEDEPPTETNGRTTS